MSYSLIIGICAAALCYGLLKMRGFLTTDFQWAIRGGQALIVGENPYLVLEWKNLFPLGTPFFYPLPAALVGIPFTFLDPYLAGALFFGVSSASLAYGILRYGQPWQLSIFLSPAFFISALVAQWSPLLLAGAFIPAMQFFMVCKPTIGLASFLYNPSKIGLLLAFGFAILSLLWLPEWPFFLDSPHYRRNRLAPSTRSLWRRPHPAPLRIRIAVQRRPRLPLDGAHPSKPLLLRPVISLVSARHQK
ncbi:MAG: DUF4175 domain-containing protein [Chloroflexi bacterium]|nr:DUF4175 domain-containing protein [Chloroflexota bacterium]